MIYQPFNHICRSAPMVADERRTEIWTNGQDLAYRAQKYVNTLVGSAICDVYRVIDLVGGILWRKRVRINPIAGAEFDGNQICAQFAEKVSVANLGRLNDHGAINQCPRQNIGIAISCPTRLENHMKVLRQALSIIM